MGAGRQDDLMEFAGEELIFIASLKDWPLHYRILEKMAHWT